ncbi:MAG: SpoIID/LytB domain-containing protein [Pyrinomonadaceae bacterium]
MSSCSAPREASESAPTIAHAAASDEEVDAALQRAATAALGTRDGSIIVLDPQTGRVRAIVNARVAFEEAIPPGSAIKPFTALAGLRAGLIDENSRVLCRTTYRRDDFETRCSHLKLNPPFDPVHALAYSCNYYFSKLGEKLNAESFDATLAGFGFGARTGSDDEREATGALPRGEWRVPYALGFGDQMLVTPAQLITAYAALFNGGHLYVPQRAASQNFIKQERAAPDMILAPAHRALLLEGLRGAVAYGTAVHAGLNGFPQIVFGKTGTSLPRDDFRTHGWFVGFAADRHKTENAEGDSSESNSSESGSSENLSPSSMRLAVLVFLKRAHGAECANLARNIFATYAHAATPHTDAQIPGDEESESTIGARAASDASQAQASTDSATTSTVRVRLVREETTRALSLDEYVFGVLAAEASTENNLEALKAQAVVSRTYALKNMNRHARDGYDFCNNTHCQRYVSVRDETARPDFYAAVRRAIKETAGEVLRDESGRVADAYFSASCGGITANIGTLWGKTPAPAYLRGVPDEYCATLPERNWTNVISRAELSKALRGDARSDVGARLTDVRVVRHDATGRAETIALEGERRRTLRGWDFKIIVGRYLGWNVLKSSRFDVSRAGENFVFRGSGFGHGLGLCQTGARAMAVRGASYRQILNRYLPGTRMGSFDADVKRTVKDQSNANSESGEWSEAEKPSVKIVPAAYPSNNERACDYEAIRFQNIAFAHRNASAGRLILSSENFQVSFTKQEVRRDAGEALRVLEAARVDLSARLKLANVGAREVPKLELFVHETAGDFVAATNQPVWVAAVTRAGRIEVQPLDVLRRRGVFASTLRHEYAHAVIESLSRGRAPHWFAEGLAIYFAGEGASVNRGARVVDLSPEELEGKLAQPAASAQETRALYAAAYRQVMALVRREGEASVWRRIAQYRSASHSIKAYEENRAGSYALQANKVSSKDFADVL